MSPGNADSRAPSWRGASGRVTGAAVVALCAAALAGFAPAARAQQFDYDPERAPALRTCDEHRDHGRADQARPCYGQLLNSSRDRLVQAESAWALGDVNRANDLFRVIVRDDDKAVRPRVRWGRLYLATHQYADAAGLFREALEIDGKNVPARIGMARVLAD